MKSKLVETHNIQTPNGTLRVYEEYPSKKKGDKKWREFVLYHVGLEHMRLPIVCASEYQRDLTINQLVGA
jgi:hypothetical protein